MRTLLALQVHELGVKKHKPFHDITEVNCKIVQVLKQFNLDYMLNLGEGGNYNLTA